MDYTVTRWGTPPAQTQNVHAKNHEDAAKGSGLMENGASITVDDGRLHIRYFVIDDKLKEQSTYAVDLVGTAEVAKILETSRQNISTSLARGKFPQPYARVAAGPLWLRRQIEEYKESRPK